MTHESTEPRYTPIFTINHEVLKARTNGKVSQLRAVLVRLPRRFIYALTPTLIRTHFLKEPRTPPKLHATSWMDGIRGLTSIVVFNLHFLMNWIQPFLGYRTPTRMAESNHLLFLPPFSLFWDVNSANLFFAISGYVFTRKALQLMQRGPSAHASLLTALSSSSFRRGFRLYLPVIAMSLLTTLLAYMGGFGLTNQMFAQRAKYFPGWSLEVNPAQKDSLLNQFRYWRKEMLILSNLWRNNPQNIEHDPHYWTVAYEYRANLQINAALLMLAQCKPVVRLVALCGIAMLYAYWGRVEEGPSFFLGAAAAQWDIMKEAAASKRGKDDQLLPSQPPASPKKGLWGDEKPSLSTWINVKPTARLWLSVSRIWRGFLYFMAIYLTSYPRDAFKHPAPGYIWINSWIPDCYWNLEYRFPKTIGSLLLLWLLRKDGTRPGIWYTVLTRDFVQYAGKVMFAFYLVHGTILHAVGYAVPWWVWSMTGGNDGNIQWFTGIFIGWGVSLALSFWAADVFHREVIGRCGSATRWIEARVTVVSG